MSNAIKNGRLPLSAKRGTGKIELSDIFGSFLDVPRDVREACEAKNLAYRWVNYQAMVANGGSHEKLWQPMTREALGLPKSPFGNAEGYERRGSLVLAFRSKDINEKHKAYLRQEAQRYSGLQKRQAEEIRQGFRDAGIKDGDVRITEGYEDENQ